MKQASGSAAISMIIVIAGIYLFSCTPRAKVIKTKLGQDNFSEEPTNPPNVNSNNNNGKKKKNGETPDPLDDTEGENMNGGNNPPVVIPNPTIALNTSGVQSQRSTIGDALQISGTATPGTTLAHIAVSVEEVGGLCLNDERSTFDEPCPHYVTQVESGGAWQFALPKSQLTETKVYEVKAQAWDTNGKSSNLASERIYWWKSAPGYVSRPCGFDMNRNGIPGEPDDCKVCNGVTTDVDFDGVDEDLIYVDADAGDDSTGDGSANNPYKTIMHAISTANGIVNGAEDIICIAGTFSETIDPRSGIESHYLLDGMEVPDNPFMLVGWDKDNDGEYPPYDSDDTAVLDSGDTLETALILNTITDKYVEIAHIEIKNYQSDTLPVIRATDTDLNHFYLHDVVIKNINEGKAYTGTLNVVYLFGNHNLISNVLFENICCRGIFVNSENTSNIRLEKITMRNLAGNDEVRPIGISKGSGIELLSSSLSANPGTWTSPTTVVGVTILNSVRNVKILDNEMIDFRQQILVNGSGADCSAPTDNIVISNNLLTNSYWNANSSIGIDIRPAGGGPTSCNYVDKVDIFNNMILGGNGTPYAVCLRSSGGSDGAPLSGRLRIHGNTCSGANIGLDLLATDMYPRSEVDVRSNIFAEIVTTNIRTDYIIGNWQANGNIFTPGKDWIWDDDVTLDFNEWKSDSGQDANSSVCAPTFENAALFDYHLTAGDTCARGQGTNISDVVAFDYDFLPRDDSAQNAGATGTK